MAMRKFSTQISDFFSTTDFSGLRLFMQKRTTTSQIFTKIIFSIMEALFFQVETHAEDYRDEKLMTDLPVVA
jgi:hypothetical protein